MFLKGGKGGAEKQEEVNIYISKDPLHGFLFKLTIMFFVDNRI